MRLPAGHDGTGYRGFQRQPHGETVEDALFGALRGLDVAFVDGSPVGYTVAGRTVAGVAARAQTVAFEAPERLRPRAFDAELPTDVRAWAVAAVEDDFHATRGRTRRLRGAPPRAARRRQGGWEPREPGPVTWGLGDPQPNRRA